MENWTNLDKGREGVKNPGNFADIICTWPLILENFKHSVSYHWSLLVLLWLNFEHYHHDIDMSTRFEKIRGSRLQELCMHNQAEVERKRSNTIFKTFGPPFWQALYDGWSAPQSPAQSCIANSRNRSWYTYTLRTYFGLHPAPLMRTYWIETGLKIFIPGVLYGCGLQL